MTIENGATPDIPAGPTTTGDVADPVTVLPGSNPAGWYPFGAAARRASWMRRPGPARPRTTVRCRRR